MGSLFRSETLTLCQLFLQSEASYNTIAELGELGLVQFRDLNPGVNAFQRKFTHEVRRCDEMERKLRFVEREIKKEEIPILHIDEMVEAPPARELIEMESSFDNIENDLKEVIASGDALRKTFLELTEMRHVLHKTQQFFDQSETTVASGAFADEAALMAPKSESAAQRPLQLSFVAGVIARERVAMFERMLWRVCRGNVYMRSSEIETALADPIYPDETVWKTAFIIFFQGEQLKMRVRKICEGCRATLYPCPDDAEERRKMIVQTASRIEDVNTVINSTTAHRSRILVSSARNIRSWFSKVRKIKAIYCTLNLFNFDVTQKCLIAECWCPVTDLDRIRASLAIGTSKSGAAVPSILNRMDTDEEPPTFNRTNKITQGFQNIVDAYGVANYKEVNPAPFTIITFPFLFAVMFGDAGHGLLMTMAAAYLVLKEQKIMSLRSNNEIFNTFFNGRYIILLMGLFSIYTGMIYNDVFAKSLNLFGSKFRVPADHIVKTNMTKFVILEPQHSYLNEPYWFGLDPIWQVSSNKILFTNSFKMKLSVILGVAQMLFGTCLSFFNHTYFKNPVNIACEFIPQIIFLLSIFGYMNLLIISKWLVYNASTAGAAPSILISLINMFMFKYDETGPLNLRSMYEGQKSLQTVLVFLAVLCIPWMLAIKPYLLNRRHKQSQIQRLVEESIRGSSSVHGNGSVREGNDLKKQSLEVESGGTSTSATEATGGGGGGHHGEAFELGDVIIHQAIHTIEYCLGSISHTASYLRLWALSLAHAQLSEVLWNMVMKMGLTLGTGFAGGVVMTIVFAFWAVLTVGVLLLMEGLSAFLHALRLHWVEFQSKFYTGAGALFDPFSFKVILANEEASVD